MWKTLYGRTGTWENTIIGEDPEFHKTARLPLIEPRLTMGVYLDGWGQARIVSNFVDGLDTSLPYGKGSLVLFLELRLMSEEDTAFKKGIESVVDNLRQAFSSYKPPADEQPKPCSAYMAFCCVDHNK
ncbi:MAG TPA: hypothetical protein VFT87_05105 [Candidatus Saccharimonadales bacterium]|nr:hypothetical protein [Candidatus Saccharimonadales bacterium]